MNNILSCLIIEDEPLAQELMTKYVHRSPYLELLGSCDNAVDGFETIKKIKPDIVFLDINMPEMTGMELLNVLGTQKPFIIITTGYPDFAVESYSFDVTDYLLKPISFNRFLQAVNKVLEKIEIGMRLGGKNNSEVNNSEVNNSEVNNSEVKYIFIKADKKNVKLVFDEVLLVEGMKDYVKIYMGKECYIIHQTMKSMVDLLPQNKFIRINRSYIVNIESVHSIEGNQIELINKRKVDIGVSYRENVVIRLGLS